MRTHWWLLCAVVGCSQKSVDSSAPSDAPDSTDDSGTSPPDGPGQISVYVGDVEVRTDADVALLDGYESIQGSVGVFEGVTDLSPLHALEEITGSLRIEDTTTLPSLAGLESLRIIGADLGIRGSTLVSLDGLNGLSAVEGLVIEDTESLQDLSALAAVSGLSRNLVLTNSNLESLAALNGLTEVRGYLNIQNAASLSSLSGLEHVSYVGKTLFIVQCPRIEDLDGLAGLLTVKESVSISDLPLLSRVTLPVEAVTDVVQIVRNPELAAIELPGLQTAGEVEIHGNPRLTVVRADSLNAVERWFQIDDNDALESIGDFSSLTSVGERVSITRNDGLTGLVSSLPALREVGENFDVHDNPALPSCEVDAVVEAITELGGLVVNTGNNDATSCE